MSQTKHSVNHPFKRFLFLCLGLIIMAFGVAFSIQAALGTSPISSIPYVTSAISGLSVGTTTIIMNFIFILIQIAILRREYDWFQILQLPAAILFGVCIHGITASNYFEQWILCAVGIFLIAFGVSVEVMAHLVTTAGEGIVLAICQKVPIRFGNMKVIFGATLVCIAVILSFLFLGHLDGVREGTIAAALFVGLITKQTNKLTNLIERTCLQ